MIRMMVPPFLRQNLGPIPHLDGNDNVGPMFDDVVDGIIGKIVDGCDPKAIVLFGSVSKGTSTEDSDIDLMVILDTDLSYYVRTLAVRKSIGVTTIPIDILAFTPEEVEKERNNRFSIIHEVLRTGKVVYGTV